MGFENIQLSSQQIGELYSSHIVVVHNGQTETEVKTTSQTTAVKTSSPSPVTSGIMGKNGKQFVWVVDEPDYPLLGDDDFRFMSDVITACKMNLDDMVLINIAQNELDFATITERFSPQFIIVSFEAANWLPFVPDTYTLQPVQNSLLYTTETLQIIRNDKAKKSKLWLALKQMLGL